MYDDLTSTSCKIQGTSTSSYYFKNDKAIYSTGGYDIATGTDNTGVYTIKADNKYDTQIKISADSIDFGGKNIEDYLSEQISNEITKQINERVLRELKKFAEENHIVTEFDMMI